MSEISVLTIPLKTEIWQDDVLFKRFEIYRSIYNAMLGHRLKEYRKMLNDEDYKNSIEVIYKAYKEEDAKVKKEIKKSQEYKDATEMQKSLLKEYGFSEFAFKSEAIKFAKHFACVTNTKVAAMSVGTPMWSAFDKMLFGNGKVAHFKKYDTWTSIVSDNKTGIRIVDVNNKTTYEMDSREQYYCLISSKKGKNLKMPLKVDKKDKYMLEMMERKIHQVRIVREKVNGKYKYSVQLAVEGAPAIKYKPNGEELHKIGTQKVGVYIDTTSITIATTDGIKSINIKYPNFAEDKIKELQQYMENSRRANNPENYNQDGTIKNGVFKDGQRHPLHWTFSNGYLRAKNQVADLLRKQAHNRKIRANKIANEIIAIGSDITVNDYPFQAAAMRKKEDQLTDKGTPASKKKAGKAISENAPATIVTVIDNKLKSRGYAGVTKKKLKVDYKLENYRHFYANQLYLM